MEPVHVCMSVFASLCVYMCVYAFFFPFYFRLLVEKNADSQSRCLLLPLRMLFLSSLFITTLNLVSPHKSFTRLLF